MPHHGLARVLSRHGICSRTQAAQWIVAGRVAVDGQVVRDPEYPIATGRSRIAIDDQDMDDVARQYIMLNKPRGLVTTTSDEHGRDTVYRCFDGAGLPWLAPVGRLDKASEGLLLFCNDPRWAAVISDPSTGPDKTYHVQVDMIPDAELLARLTSNAADNDEPHRAKSVQLMRHGTRNSWLEIVLDQGRNRQIRRLLDAFDINVLRLIRIAIGDLVLGDLPKGQWRRLQQAEVAALAPAATPTAARQGGS